ncbi:MAG: hypothetical protein B6U73_01525 [Desulfurococcales archaeon ex4484_204]|nr:MAG: hypothetical protein B6U73_01525 [Desulfurococcales archaeon ex4484_204]
MTEGSNTGVDAGFRIEYKKVKEVLELNPRVFRPCEIKDFEKGFLRKQIYFVHFNGRKWDILRISNNGIERYILE